MFCDPFQLAGHRIQPALSSLPFHQWHSPDGSPWADFHRAGAGYLVRFPQLADFEVSADGRKIRCWAMPNVTLDTVRHLHLNQVMPLALGRQGKLVLHGSAIEAGGQALAFLGLSGRGKSTLAASFACAGHRFLTDDGLVLECEQGQWLALPSHPSIRLWQDSEEAVLGSGFEKAPALPYTGKSRFLAGDHLLLCDSPRPLRHFYVLGDRDVAEPTIEPVKDGEALIQLVSHSFLLDIEERDSLVAHFDELCALVRAAPVYRLDYPRDYGRLAELRQAVLDHARTSCAALQ